MGYMKVNRAALERALRTTKRNQFISGKEHPQVVSCILRAVGDRVTTTSIVKDGKTSVARFSFAGDGFPINIPVPDIDRLLGALKYHGVEVKLDANDDKLVVRSGKKQTTMSANSDGRAFPNTQTTIAEWENNSINRADSLTQGGYKMHDGQVRKPFYTISMEAEDLFDALRCDEMNGQRMNRYTFELGNSVFKVIVGDHLKGRTEIVLSDDVTSDTEFTATFEGGLEYVLKHYNCPVNLHFYDFTPEGQGYRLCIWFTEDDFVFQAGVL